MRLKNYHYAILKVTFYKSFFISSSFLRQSFIIEGMILDFLLCLAKLPAHSINYAVRYSKTAPK